MKDAFSSAEKNNLYIEGNSKVESLAVLFVWIVIGSLTEISVSLFCILSIDISDVL